MALLKAKVPKLSIFSISFAIFCIVRIYTGCFRFRSVFSPEFSPTVPLVCLHPNKVDQRRQRGPFSA